MCCALTGQSFKPCFLNFLLLLENVRIFPSLDLQLTESTKWINRCKKFEKYLTPAKGVVNACCCCYYYFSKVHSFNSDASTGSTSICVDSAFYLWGSVHLLIYFGIVDTLKGVNSTIHPQSRWLHSPDLLCADTTYQNSENHPSSKETTGADLKKTNQFKLWIGTGQNRQETFKEWRWCTVVTPGL